VVCYCVDSEESRYPTACPAVDGYSKVLPGRNIPTRSSVAQTPLLIDDSIYTLKGCITISMQIGITGHQERHGIDWNWVEATLEIEICKVSNVRAAMSSLAKGADQIFARVAISLGIPVIAVVPVSDYSRFFEGQARIEYDWLLSKSLIQDLQWKGEDQLGFFSAGKFIVENSDVVFAVWDQQRSRGLGGTADIVDYARQLSKKIVHLNPIARSVQELTGGRNG
jgi:hypothetical protein